MKKLLYLAAVCAALMSCKTIYTDDPDAPKHDSLNFNPNPADTTAVLAPVKKFTFHVKGAFDVSFNEMTRASVRLENDNTAGITDIWVLDYAEDGTLLQQVHQTPSDADFGHPNMQLTYGHHDVKFIASKGDTPALSASALSWQKVKDTFVLDYPVDVVASSNGNRAPELKRAVSGVTLVMTDNVPANAKSIKVEYMRSQSLALPSLVAGATSLSGVTNTFHASWIGQTGSFSVYTLCPTDEMTTDVHVVVKATDGSTISDFTIEDVQLKKNRMTVLTGECFGRGSGFQVSVDADWDAPLEINF